MKNQTEIKTLDQILFEFLTENETPTRDVLTDWIQRYPQYQKELIDLAVDWFELSLPLSSNTSIKEAAVIVHQGVDFVQDKLLEEEMRRQVIPKTRKQFRGFVKEGRAIGLSLGELANRVGLTPALLAKIDRRMVRFTSLPLVLIQALAEAVNCNVLTSVHFLQLQPVISTNERFKSSQPPKIGEQANFFDEVRADPEMSDDQRKRWLALEPEK